MKNLFLIFGILVWFGQGSRIYFPQANSNMTITDIDWLIVRDKNNNDLGRFTRPYGFSWITDEQESLLNYDGTIMCIGYIEIQVKK